MRTVTLLVLAVLVAGCEQKKQVKKADDELTIVVEADRSRIAAEEAALAEQRKAIAAERDRLRREVDQLDAAKGGLKATDVQALDMLQRAVKLVRESEEMAEKRDALARERELLAQKTQADPGRTASGADVASWMKASGEIVVRERELATREKTFAEREAALASREAAIAQREAAGVPAREHTGSTLSRASVERAYKDLLAAMEAKGVLALDLSPSRQRALKEAAAFQRGDLAQAMEAIDQVEFGVRAITIDSAFVAEKARRVDALAHQSDGGTTMDPVARLLQEATRAYSDGRFREANQALNEIIHLLEKGS